MAGRDLRTYVVIHPPNHGSTESTMRQCTLVFVGTELKLTTNKTIQNLAAVQHQPIDAEREMERDDDDDCDPGTDDATDSDMGSLCDSADWCPCFVDLDPADCTLEELEEIFRLCTHQYESSYTPTRMLEQMRQCVRKRRIEYDHLHPRELKLMVTTRSLHDPFPSGITLKVYYLHQLHKADKSFTFRLMDLPAEVRLLILTEILTWPEDRCHNHKFGFPQILRTSRQIYREARGIMENTNTFECAFTVNEDYQHAVINREHFGCGAQNKDIWLLPGSIDNFPTFLKRIKKLSINLNISEPTRYGIVQVNHCMLALASFLMEGHRLNKLIITIRLHHDDLDNTAADVFKPEAILYPFSRLRNIFEVSIKGDLVPVETAASVVAVMQGSGPTFNTIRDFEMLYSEANSFVKLKTAMDPFGRDDDDWDGGHVPISVLIEHLQDDVLGDCIDTTEREESLRKRLEALDVTLVNYDSRKILLAAREYNRLAHSRRAVIRQQSTGRT